MTIEREGVWEQTMSGAQRRFHDQAWRRVRVLWLLLLCLPLAACLPESYARGDKERVVVEMREPDRYAPATLTIAAGTTVVWENHGNGPHTATFDDAGSGELDSGDIYPGDRWLHTFDQPGEYLFYCLRHADTGMIGLLTVTA
jgi:plastocyanin